MATEIARQLARLLLRHRPPKACVLLGPRGAGKTTILRMLAEGRAVSWFDGDDGAVAVEQLRLPSSADVRSLLVHSKSIVIDEAQRVPSVGLLLKRLVDVNVSWKSPSAFAPPHLRILGLPSVSESRRSDASASTASGLCLRRKSRPAAAGPIRFGTSARRLCTALCPRSGPSPKRRRKTC